MAMRSVVSRSIGFVVCRFPLLRGYKLYLLSTTFRPQARSAADRCFYRPVFHYWLKFEYRAESDPSERELLKSLVMGGESGAAWANRYDTPPPDFDEPFAGLTWGQAYRFLPEMDMRLAEEKQTIDVIQVGASSGGEIAWLAERHPRHNFIGTDIYEEVVSYQESHHKADNLAFSVCSALDIAQFIGAMNNDRRVLVGFSGVLEYIHPNHLQEVFVSLSEIPRTRIVVFEPASDAEGSPDTLSGSRPRTIFSYTHDYRFYAELSGMTTETCRIIRPYVPPESYPGKKDTVRYLWCGSTSG
jgi:hypothetical protein